ncbi:MAG: putative Ig domain-containing protein [Candidatus Sulfotelmatobacter sp.]
MDSETLTLSGNLPVATVGHSYNAVLSVTGGAPPYQFALASGTLPEGATLSPSSGAISGNISKAGSFGFIVVVTDLPRRDSGFQQFALSATSAASPVKVTITPSSLVSLRPGATQQFSAAVTGASNTAVTWSASTGKISATGLYTAPAENNGGRATVTATSIADPAEASEASVKVEAVSTPVASTSGPDNRYCAAGNTPDFGATSDGPAALPTACFYTALSATPSPGAVTAVAAGSDLQDVIDDAKCGDTLMLQAGAVWTVTQQIGFPDKGCNDSNWITIRTSASDAALPPEGTRMTPCYAGVSSLPGRPALSCSSTENVLAKIQWGGENLSGPIVFKDGATHYRFIGLEITKQKAGQFVEALASPSKNSSFDHVIFDRVWFHGDAADETTRGILLDGGTYVAVIDSYFTDFHCKSMGMCSDAQALAGGNGSLPIGTYKIVDNFLEASGESVIFGGSSGAYTPADIEIRRNHFFKPMTWLEGQPGFVGVRFVVKNHLEFKNAQRVLVEGNVMEDTWGGFSQAGFSVLVTPKNDGACSVCRVSDITIRYDTISHVGGGFQLADTISATGFYAKEGQRYSIHDVVVDDINAAKYAGHGVFAQVDTQVKTSDAPLLQNLTIDHVTAFPDAELLNIGGAVSPKMTNFSFTNSIVNSGEYPVWSTGGTTNCARPDVPLTVLDACFSALTFSGNIIIAPPKFYIPSRWPSDNSFAASAADVNFVNFNGGIGGNYELSPSSQYKGRDPLGKDPGADIAGILTQISGVY